MPQRGPDLESIREQSWGNALVLWILTGVAPAVKGVWSFRERLKARRQHEALIPAGRPALKAAPSLQGLLCLTEPLPKAPSGQALLGRELQ